MSLPSGTVLTLEDLADHVSLLGVGRVDWVTLGALCKLLVADRLLGVFFHAVVARKVEPLKYQQKSIVIRCNSYPHRYAPIDPRVADTVGELLLLAPKNAFGQVRLAVWADIEGFAEEVLLHLRFAVRVPLLVRTLGELLLGGVDVHAHFQEALVKEWDAKLKTPRHGRLVGTQTVSGVQVLDALNALLVERLLVWRCVEVEVSTKDLVTALTREYHLDAHSLDLAAEQVHGCTGAHGSHVVSFEVEDDVANGIEALLDSEGVLVVDCAKVLSCMACCDQIGAVGQTDRE